MWCGARNNEFGYCEAKLVNRFEKLFGNYVNGETIEIVEGNIQNDHIHPVLSIPPKYSVSEAVGFLKGKSVIKIFDFHHELKRRYWGRHFWSKGYCVREL